MTRHSTVSMPDGQTLISVQCIDCKQQKQFSVSTAGYEQWMAGILIQRAMPEIPAGERGDINQWSVRGVF